MPDVRSSVPATRRSARRREDLVDAAVRAFTAKGVVGTSVDDIVRSAGVAKGTFYLYFESRDDVVAAVAQRLVEGIGQRMDEALVAQGRSAAERIGGIAGAMASVGGDPLDVELLEALHGPGNDAVHDRLTAGIVGRLLPAVAQVVEDGIASGEFSPQDPQLAAAFVLGCFTAIHDLVGNAGDLPGVVAGLNAFILRGLGQQSAASR